MKTLVIQLDRLEDTGSIRDKVTWGKSSRVLLVWPVNYTVFTRKVDLISIKRICASQGSRLGIVCDDPEVIAEAGELQIPVFNSVNQAMRKGWDRRKRKKTDALDLPPLEHWEGIEDIRQRKGMARTLRIFPFSIRLILLIAGLAAVIITGIMILPAATIRIYPLGQSGEMNVWFTVRDSDAVTTGPDALSAKRVEMSVETTTERTTTGELPLADKKASGLLTITNLTEDEIMVPAGTVVMDKTNPPVRYQIIRDAQIEPGFSTTEVPVEAVYGGESGNAEAGEITRIEGEFGLKLELTNPSPITGGTDRNIPAPSQDDIAALKNEIQILLIKEAEQKISTGLQDDEILLSSTIKSGNILREKTQPEIGQAGNSVRITREVEVSALIINRKDLSEKARAIFRANKVLPGWKISENEPVDVRILSQEFDAINGLARVNTIIKCRTIPIIDEEQIRRGLAGKRLDEAAANIASQVLIERPTEFETWPMRLLMLPFLESRIRIALP